MINEEKLKRKLQDAISEEGLTEQEKKVRLYNLILEMSKDLTLNALYNAVAGTGNVDILDEIIWAVLDDLIKHYEKAIEENVRIF